MDYLKTALKTVAIILGAYLLSDSCYMTGLYTGLSNAGPPISPNLSNSDPPAFSFGISDLFGQIIGTYISLNWLLFIYVVIRWGVNSLTFSLFTLLIGLVSLGLIVILHIDQLEFAHRNSEYLDVMQQTVRLRQISIAVSIGLVFTEIALVIEAFVSKRKARENNATPLV